MYRTLVFLVIVAAASFILSLGTMAHAGKDDAHRAAEHRHEHAAEHQHGQGGSPLIDEMVILDNVFRDVVSAVSVGDGGRVHTSLEKMHGTMERTHDGVSHGTVKLRKNADRMAEFVAQDKEFHARLEKLAQSAHKNDQDAMLSLTKDLLDRCVKCHKEFR